MSNSFISAIDNHNVANGDESWFAKRISATGEFVNDVADALTMGAPSAVLAGVNSILNTGAAVGNFMGASIEPFNTYDQLRSLDSDLGQYYQAHKDGIETAGFIATSFVPGMAGVKMAQAAKAGFMGSNTLRATGLMETLTRDYAKVARAEFASGTSPFTILNADTIKSLAQGFGSQAIDMAAFETMVAATMYKSPMLDGQGFTDIVHHIGVGTLIGGGIGGVLHGMTLVAGMKQSRAIFNAELHPYKNINELGDLASPEMKVISYYQQKLNLPEAALLEDVGPMGNMKINKDLLPEERLKLINEEREKTVNRLDNLIKQELNHFAGGDAVIAERMQEVLNRSQTPVEVSNALMHSKGMQRITESEKLAYGDVLFPVHDMSLEGFQFLRAGGDWDKMFTPKGSDQAKGFIVKGNLAELKVTGAKIATDFGVSFESREAAFNAGYDLYRNANGAVSVNPESKILIGSPSRRTANNLIIDFENNGAIVDRATPSLVDFATHGKPITVNGNHVIAGDLRPIDASTTFKYDPTKGTVLDAQARTIWANSQKPINWSGKTIGENDLPLLERAYYDGDKAKDWVIKLKSGEVVLAPKGEHLRMFIEDQKKKLLAELNGRPLDEISTRLNVSEKWLRGENDEIAKIRAGVDWNKPRYARVNYAENLDAAETLRTNVVEGMVEYERQVGLIRQRHAQNFNNYAKEEAAYFPDAPNITDPGRLPRGYGAGASLFGFSNAALGSYEGWAQFVGSLTNKLKLKNKTVTAEELNPVLAAVQMAGNDAIAELSLVTNKIRSSPEAFVFHPEFPDTLIPRRSLKSIAEGGAEATETIKIKSPEVLEFLKTHSSINGRRQAHVDNLKSAAGVGSDFDANVVYAPPINTEAYKHFVFVKPKGQTLADKTRIIAAKDEATLQKLIKEVDKDQFRVVTKSNAEEFHKAQGDYDFSLGLNESRVDSELKRKGTLSDFLPTTSSRRILDDYMDFHMRQEELLATRMVEHRYSPDFQTLERLGERYTDVATSQFRSLSDKLKESVKDPYYDIVKTSLDISRSSEYQWWRGFNDTIRNAIEQPINKLREAFAKTERVDDAFVDRVNKISEDLGLGKPFVDAHAAMVANGNIAPKPWLAQGIAKAQSILSTTLLQWDFFNAINNQVSTTIILSAEVNYLRAAIEKANPEVAGKLTNLMKVTSPDGSGIELPTTARLVKQAIENYRGDSGALLTRYQNIRAVTSVLQQERQMLEQLTFDFKGLTEPQMNTRLQKASEFAKTWTGNKLAEESSRFIAADVMRQITDIAIEAGVLKDLGEANEYITNFVNKTQGNYLSSQRPIVFQGVVGQAVSLFQTYQFNLMQQLFKYAGEGDKKSLGILLGLQGSIYGMQGLPAFNFINTHIVGNASGNTQHRDLYYAANTVFGKSLGDWIFYGAGSNALGLVDPQLKINLYSRGDINPRQVTVLPTSLEDIPILNASTRFVSNLYSASEKIAKGGAFWPSISQAVEHNGLSRPLAGLAQVLQGYTTTSQGSLLSASQDYWLVSNLARVGGGKPFDEAVALDALYRVNAYRAKDLSQIQELGSVIKSNVIGGKLPSEEQTVDFAKAYVRNGGKIDSFNRFFANVMTNANQSQVNKLAQNLSSPFAVQMQLTMGGRPLPDFLNIPSKD